MPLLIGDISEFIVKRETQISYTINPIDNPTIDVFLHFNQAKEKLMPGQKIEAFLFYDSKRRLCATTETPGATVSKPGFCEVVNVTDIGCFINIHTAKDILLSKDDLPLTQKAWPQVGDKLPIILKERRDTLLAKIVSREDIKEKKEPLTLGEHYNATVTHFTSSGIIAVTENMDMIYIHKSLMRRKYRLGEIINVRISNINEKGEADGSLIEQKEKMISSDAELLLTYLKEFHSMPLGNASTPEEIAKLFPLSKSAFKRAVGALYKERLISIEDYRITYLKDE